MIFPLTPMQYPHKMNWDFARVLGFEILRYTTMVYRTMVGCWRAIVEWYQAIPEYTPHRQYYLSTTREFSEEDLRVPEGCVYIEEWVKNGEKKCVVRYPGEVIPAVWGYTPFEQPARCPWVWVGDRATEIDLTRTFAKFLVPGNRITFGLVEKLIQINDRTDLIYIESGTFRELKFPGEGLLIKANGDD